jgi:hypothetical protein
VSYTPGSAASPSTPVLTVSLLGAPAQQFTTQQLVGQEGLVITLPAALGEIAIGEDPRAIGGDAASKPELAANGTVAGAAVDVVRIKATLAGAALGLADLRVGHMESKATVPPGGIQCGIPVSKSGTPASVEAGKDQLVTYTITVPADIEAFKAVACDLVNLKVVDVTTAETGVKFNIVSASNNGVISGNNTVTWDKLTYKPGDPAIVLTVGLKVPAGSAAGKITDVATATAVLGNCKGNESATAASLTGLAALDSAALTGSDAFSGSATTVAGASVLPGTAGPTPIGGVQTGAGGTSSDTNRLLPLSAALGLAGLVGLTNAAIWRRRSV